MYVKPLVLENGDFAEGVFLSPTITKNELQNKFWHGEYLVVTGDGVERLEEDETR